MNINDIEVEQKPQFFRYKAAANILVLNFIVEWLAGILFGAYADISSTSTIHITSLIRSIFWTYIWLTFRRLMDEQFQYRGTDPFLIVIILMSFIFPLMGISGLLIRLPSGMSVLMSIGFSAVLILFAFSILKMKGDLFGLKKSMAITLIVQTSFSTIFYQILHIYTFRTLFVGARMISFLLSILLAILLFRIFRMAAQVPLVPEPLPEDNLIDEIGGEIEEI